MEAWPYFLAAAVIVGVLAAFEYVAGGPPPYDEAEAYGDQ